MQNHYKNTKRILVTGSIIAGAIFGAGAPSTLNAANLFDFNNLGSGAELRASLLNTSPERTLEMKCGNKSDSKSPKADDPKAKDSKAKDGKCGEGKCGDKKMNDAKATKPMDSKAKDGKCGEGKCGEKKKDAKSMDKKEMKEMKEKKESKPAEKK
ncbi:MAG: hypothetical protein CVV24_00475 [Ignavibacteriae bacterium HGW-Ignavibacteriae-3]|nr:MAG: hypothetical protein CVV24_00475 [Ignavibacteriae bacterium HGW-Ignavibacteriae-3]